MLAQEAISAILQRSAVEDATKLAQDVVTEYEARLAELTPEQIETMRMVCSGLLNKEISRDLKVCIRTVEARRGRITKALGVSNATELGFVVGIAEAFRFLLSQTQSPAAGDQGELTETQRDAELSTTGRSIANSRDENRENSPSSSRA